MANLNNDNNNNNLQFSENNKVKYELIKEPIKS